MLLVHIVVSDFEGGARKIHGLLARRRGLDDHGAGRHVAEGVIPLRALSRAAFGARITQ